MSLPTSSPVVETLLTIQQQLIRYVYSTWLIFGIIGCILNLFIFSRPKLRATSCCIYFFAASLDHLFTLLVGVVPIVYTLDHPDPQSHSLLFCKLRGYLFQIALMLSRWFVAFACIDRYAQCSETVHRRNFAHRRIAYRCIVAIVIVWSIVCTHRLIFYEIQGNLCGILRNTGAAIYHTLYVIIGGGLLPTTIMLTCALLIRRNLAFKKQKLIQGTLVHRTKFNDHQVLQLLYIQIICYIVFTMPQMSYLIFNAFSNIMPDRSADRLVIEEFAGFLAELMLYMFPVTSFYLYTLTSRTFRRELINAIRLLPFVRLMCLNRHIVPLGSMRTVNPNAENQQVVTHINVR